MLVRMIFWGMLTDYDIKSNIIKATRPHGCVTDTEKTIKPKFDS